MVRESILENSLGQNALLQTGIALGRITSVNPDKRFCEVKIFFGSPGLLDQHIANVQWLSTDANPEGDESTSIPRVGSTGLVFFVQGAAFMWGYFKATHPKNGAVTGQEQTKLNEGDKVISTVGGNRVVVKANGVVEVHSKETLKTIYFPKDGLLSHICEAFQLKGDGGNVSWKVINKLNETLHRAEYRKDLGRTSIISEEKGRVDATTIKRVAIGPGVPGTEGVQVPVFEYTIGITGEVKCNVGLAGTGLSLNVTPLGGMTVKNLLSSVVLSESGDWELKTPLGKFTLSKAGDLEFKGPIASASLAASGAIQIKNALTQVSIATNGSVEVKTPVSSITISAAGEIEIKTVNKLKVDAKAGVDIKSLGPAKIEAIGPVNIKGLTIGLDGTGGGGAIHNVLCFPLTVSQFTGAPLSPFSTTVKVSP